MKSQTAFKIDRLAPPKTLSEAIVGRRSVREFSTEEVPVNLLEAIIELAQWAPSAYNRQDWRFAVLKGNPKERAVEALGEVSAEFTDKISALFPEKMTKKMEGFFKTMGKAPVIIFIYADKSREPSAGLDAYEAGFASACAAAQNLLLAAHAEGLGGCWVQAFRSVQEKIDEITGIYGRALVGGVPLGFPAQNPPAPSRKQGRVKWLGFGKD